MRASSSKTVVAMLAAAVLLVLFASNALADDYADESQKDVQQVTLITGDTVEVWVWRDGTTQYRVGASDVAQGTAVSAVAVTGYVDTEGYYVPPPRRGDAKLDRELFNLRYLIDNGYHEQDSLPVIIGTGPDAKPEPVAEAIAALGADARPYNALPLIAASLPKASIAAVTEALLEDSAVKAVWLDRRVSVSLATSVPLIGAPSVWSAGYRGEGIEIAVLDTGVDAAHPDLDDLDDVATTTDPKVIRVVDFTNDATTTDLHGHGTHVAGIAAGTGAGGSSGVAPGANVWSVKVLGASGSGSTNSVISGIEYAFLGPDGLPKTGDEADVINMSLGDSTPEDGNEPLSLAADKAVDEGLVVVIAAGNDGSAMFTLNSPGVARKPIAVAATDNADAVASFSSRGPTIDRRLKPDIAAPGVGIAAANHLTAGTKVLSGTSMASPHVAGMAALLLQAHPTWTPQMVKAALMNTALPLSGPNLWAQGAGRVRSIAITTTLLAIEPSLSLGQLHGGYAASSTFSILNLATTSVTVSLVATTTFGGTPVAGTSIAPTSTVIAAGASSTATLTVRHLPGDSVGYYEGRVTLVYPASQISVPYLYRLDLPPSVSVSPSSLTTTITHLQVATSTVTVTNAGTGDLEFSLSGAVAATTVVPWLCFDSPSGLVTPSSSADLAVQLNCDRSLAPGTHTGEVVVTHNDPAKGVQKVPVTVKVLAPSVGVSPVSLVVVLEPGETTTGAFTVSNSGTGTLTYTVAVEQPNVSGGPDAFGHVWSDSDDVSGPGFSWIEISGTGASIGFGDDASFAVPIGFDFAFYGTTYTTTYVGTNGLLGFVNASLTSPFNAALPGASAPDGLVAAFWDDLEVQSSARLLYELVGAEPSRKLVVQWDGVQEYGDTGASHTFEIVLEEATGDIVLQYLTMSGDLDSATVGIEDTTGTDGLTVVFNDTYVKDGLAVRFSKDNVYVSVASATGALAPGSNVGLGLTFDATGLGTGAHPAEVVVNNNDPDQQQVRVPVTVGVSIPSLGEWGMVLLGLALAAVVATSKRRRYGPSSHHSEAGPGRRT